MQPKKVAIIGGGSLGWAFSKACLEKGVPFKIFTQDNSSDPENMVQFEWPQSGIGPIKKYKPDLIINCLGAGSIKEAREVFNWSSLCLVGLPQALMSEMKDIQQIHFSSNYASHNSPPTEYGMLKHFMERLAAHYNSLGGKTKIIRVETLVSDVFPERSIIHKIAEKLRNNEEIQAVNNIIRPTNVDDIARYVMNVDHLDLVPTAIAGEPVRVSELAYMIARELQLKTPNIVVNGYDDERPKADIGATLIPEHTSVHSLIAEIV